MLRFHIEMRHELPCHSRLETYIILKVITGGMGYIRNLSPYGNVLHTKKNIILIAKLSMSRSTIHLLLLLNKRQSKIHNSVYPKAKCQAPSLYND